MKIFYYNTNQIEGLYNLRNNFLKSPFIIIDNEIQNDISKDWVYENGKLSVVGFLFDNKIEIYVSETEDDKEFKIHLTKRLKDLSINNNLYSFNKYMEMGNFKGDLNIDIKINEIKPFNAKGWNKDRFFNELQEQNIIPRFKVYDPFESDAGLCVTFWEDYLKTKDTDKLKQIVIHNINCLIKESLILKHRSFFTENYEINERNWLVD